MKPISLCLVAVFLLLTISCTPKAENQVPVFDLSELIVDTLYLEKDTLTKDLGDNFSYFKTDSGEVLAAFLNHRFIVFS